jgi:8-oxo-dGTP diphosphatase
MRFDGNGWVRCAHGHRHWGRHGAAGLLICHVDPGGTSAVLLQHRAAWSHHGDTWGIPGGARDSHETAEEAALREAAEECRLDLDRITVTEAWEDDHGGWSYTTVQAVTPLRLPVEPQGFESVAVSWVPIPDVDLLPLHPGFAATWPTMRQRLE